MLLNPKSKIHHQCDVGQDKTKNQGQNLCFGFHVAFLCCHVAVLTCQVNQPESSTLWELRALCFHVGYANDYTFTERPCRTSDRIECHRDIARVKQAIQL